jgi:Protein of unknown function (DUF1761)
MITPNTLAIFLAALAAFVLGFLWHGPLFGKTWMRLTNTKMPEGDELKKAQAQMWKPLSWNFLTNLIMAFVLAHVYVFTQKTGLLSKNILIAGAQITFWIWLGFIVCSSAAQVIWEKKNLHHWLFTMAYHFCALLIMSWIIALL